jgi:ATP synthase protein I
MPPDEQEDLKRLGERIAEAEQRRTALAPAKTAAPIGIAFRIVTELFSGLFVGGGLGWCVDWAFDHWSHWHTRPWGFVALFVVGAVLGIRNVIRTALAIEAERAKQDKDRER